MSKLIAIAIVLGVTIAAYLLVTVVMPTFTDIVNTVNATLDSSANMSNYPGTSEVLVSTPLFMYFVPGVLAVAAVVFILVKKDDQS